MKTGPAWWSKTDQKPTDWNPIAQMEDAGIGVKREPAKETSFVSTSSSTAVVGGRGLKDWKGWAAAPSGQRDGILPGAVFR
ncbi:MAG TPA: hypothetical protein VMB18_19545 [Terriglobales bacterium]|nr:hypothetical protein [Terriglobales bacterium]